MKDHVKKVKRQSFLKILNIALTILCVVSLMGSGVVFAASNKSNVLSIKNIFQTDKVNVDLKITSDETSVVPGKTMSYISTITNKGTEAYIRAYIQLDPESGLSLDDFNISNGWQYKDGYYYYPNVVNQDESMTLCNGINVPIHYGKTSTNFDVKVTVDAIQARNFTPNFQTSQPWGSVEIKKYENTGVYQYQKSDSETNDIHITYNGKANELISNQEDFFTHMPTLVPGDVYQNTIVVKNDFDHEARLYFEAHPNDELGLPSQLLEQISLKILDNEDKEIFNGNLSQDIENQVVLKLKANETKELSFELELSKDADNAYTNLDNFVNWYFNTQFASNKKPGDKKDPSREEENTPENKEEKTDSTITKEDTKKTVNAVKTGDDTNMNMVIILFALGIVSGICALYLNHSRKTYCGDINEK